MELLYFEIAILLVLGVIVSLIKTKQSYKKKSHKIEYQYNKKHYFMTKAEHAFYETLLQALGDNYYIFPQIHLASFLDHRVVGQDWNAAFRHIDEKSVDFILCDKASLTPLLAIEVDDSSHEREDRKQRDTEVERIFKQANLPLIRFENHGLLNKDIVAQRVFEEIKNSD